MADVLVQTMLPARLAAWLKKQAARDGVSVAAYLRRCVMREHESTWVRAWVFSKDNRPRLETVWTDSSGLPHLRLERIAAHPNGAVDFRVYEGEGAGPGSAGRPMTATMLASLYDDIRKNLHEGWVALDGSADAWTVIHQMADSNAGGQITVRLEQEPQRRYDLTPSWWHKANETQRVRALDILAEFAKKRA